MRQLFASVRNGWRNVGTGPKGWLFAAIALLGMLSIRDAILYGNKTETRILFSGLTNEHEAKVVRHMRENGIPFGIMGQSIFVQKDMADSLRAQIVDRGLLSQPTEAFAGRHVAQAAWASFTREKTRPQCALGGR